MAKANATRRSRWTDEDTATLRELLVRAAEAALATLREVPVPHGRWRTYRAIDFFAGSLDEETSTALFQDQLLERPDYSLQGPVADHVEATWMNQQTGELLDFLWAKGVIQYDLPAGESPESHRYVWGREAHTRWVLGPIRSALEQSCAASLVGRGECLDWETDPIRLAAAIEDYVEWQVEKVKGRRLVRATCLLPDLDFDLSGGGQLAPELTIVPWTLRRNLEFFTRWAGWFYPSMGSVATRAAEVRLSVARGDEVSPNELWERVSDRRDALKLVLMSVSGTDEPLGEGHCLFRYGAAPEQSTTIAPRTDWWSRKRVSIGPSASTQCCSLANLLLQAQDAGGDVADAVVFFGRSCISPTSRDILLDAATGMDLLLTTRGPEAAYRFALHGAALLAAAGHDFDAAMDTLGTVYGKRSGASHGSIAARASLSGEAKIARQALASVVAAVLLLQATGKLRISSRQKVADAIKLFVCERLASALR